MEFNARINWMPGMELTAQTFREFEDLLDYRQQLALKVALGRNQLGLLPESKFDCKGFFVKNTFEIPNLKCLAILPSGKLIDAEGEVVVNIPMLYGEEYYLGVACSSEIREFEKDGVPFKQPNYDYALYTLEDLKKRDIFPLVKFKAKEGEISLYEDYIVPVLYISENKRILELVKDFIHGLEIITSHSNLEEGDGKRSLLRYLFRLKCLDSDSNLVEFISLIQEMVQAIDYFIVSPNVETPWEIPLPDFYDIEKWLIWVRSYFEGTEKVLDKIVLEDHTIDYNALLEEAKKQLYEKLRPELLELLPNQIKEAAYSEIVDKLKEYLPSYLSEKLSEIEDRISVDLSQILEPKLFDELYKKLYDALYVAPEEEEDFMPVI